LYKPAVIYVMGFGGKDMEQQEILCDALNI
jgi:hypothetical protein